MKDGWLYTGDLVKEDEEGFIYIVDRKKTLSFAAVKIFIQWRLSLFCAIIRKLPMWRS